MSDGEPSIAITLPDGSQRPGRGHLVQGRQYVAFETPAGARVQAPEDSERVRVLHPGAFAAFICLWVRYRDATDPLPGRRRVEPLSPLEIKRMVQQAYAAYNTAMRTGKFGLALTIACRHLPALPRVKDVTQSDVRIRERQEDAALAFADLRRRLAASRDTGTDRAFILWHLEELKEDFPILCWREAMDEGRWQEALQLAQSGAVTPRHLHESVQGLFHQAVADGQFRLANALARRYPNLLHGK